MLVAKNTTLDVGENPSAISLPLLCHAITVYLTMLPKMTFPPVLSVIDHLIKKKKWLVDNLRHICPMIVIQKLLIEPGVAHDIL